MHMDLCYKHSQMCTLHFLTPWLDAKWLTSLWSYYIFLIKISRLPSTHFWYYLLHILDEQKPEWPFHNSIVPVYIKIVQTCESSRRTDCPNSSNFLVFLLAQRNTAQILNETRAAEPDDIKRQATSGPCLMPISPEDVFESCMKCVM